MGSFLPLRSTHDHAAIARLFEKAVNARDFGAIELLVADGITVLDSLSQPVVGRSLFVAALRRVFESLPGLTVSYDEIAHSDGGLLIRGFLQDTSRGLSVPSLWTMTFTGPLIAQVQSFRESNSVSLASFSRQVSREV